MLKQLINSSLTRIQYWRQDDDELSEIYASMLLRSLAISMAGLFAPVYVYKLGYSLSATLGVMFFYFVARSVIDIIAGYSVARIGPKHSLGVGQVLLVASSALFLTLPSMTWPLALPAIFWGAAQSFFFVPFHVGFSKVKHQKHAGQEVGFEQSMERIGFGLGPIAGGLVALLFGAQYIFLVSMLISLACLWPLFRSAEPTRIKQKLNFKGLDMSKHKRDLLSFTALEAEHNLALVLWPLYLAIFILVTNSVYFQIGVVTGVSVIASVSALHIFGKAVDRKNGRRALRISTGLNALIHLLRPLILSFPAAIVTNLMTDFVNAGYRIPYIKGWYDTADSLPGFRIVYITSLESFASLCKAVVWGLLALWALAVSAKVVFITGFVLAACASLLIATERFRSLGRN